MRHRRPSERFLLRALQSAGLIRGSGCCVDFCPDPAAMLRSFPALATRAGLRPLLLLRRCAASPAQVRCEVFHVGETEVRHG
eukprot:gene8002-biopygen19604